MRLYGLCPELMQKYAQDLPVLLAQFCEGNIQFSKTANFKCYQAKLSGDLLDGVVRYDSASSRMKMMLI